MTAAQLTVTGRQPRVIPTIPPLADPSPPLKPHPGRRHHFVTVAARRLAPTDLPAAVESTQLLQGCSRNCGRRRVTVIPGHWPVRALVQAGTVSPDQ